MKREFFRKVYRWVVLFITAVVLCIHGIIHAQNKEGTVYVAEVQGVISPPSANYLMRVLDEAELANASLVVIQLDTPGGLDTSMREIIQAILDSPVPVAIYVTPAGARAASAGLFLLMSSHIAVMAPNTNTGAAHPVGLGQNSDETMMDKVVSDAAALIRSLAVRRERNASWAEQAVRESVSVTEQEALELNVIDLTASTLDDLLQQIEGQTIETATGTVTLRVVAAPRYEAAMSFSEEFLHVVLNPNFAFILLSIGSIGIIAELYNPGTLIPGITGVIALILAFFALGNLPTNWAGVLLIVMAVILFIAELNTDGTGVLSIGAIVAFVLGSLILFRPFQPGSPALPSLEVNPWVIGLTTATISGFMLFVIGKAISARNAPIQTGSEHFIGQSAQVRQDLTPEGRVWFEGQYWFARSVTGEAIVTGQEVRIIGLENLTLLVEALPANAPATSSE